MISVSKKLFQPFKTLSFLYSFKNKEQKIDFHQANLSRKILMLIEGKLQIDQKDTIISNSIDCHANSELQMSLRQRIIDLIDQYPEDSTQILQSSLYSPQKIAKRILSKYFTSGVWVNKLYYSNPKNTLQNVKKYEDVFFSEQMDKSLKQSKQNSEDYIKMVFCPTYMVTRKTFKYLTLGRGSLLLTGGAGKTHAVLLYCLLSEMILRYRNKYRDNQILSQNSLITKDLTKVIYLRADLNDLNQNLVWKAIRRQCYEMKSLRQKHQQTKGLIRQRWHDEYSRKNIQPLLVIDSIDCMINAIKRFKFYEAAKQSKKQRYNFQLIKIQSQKDKQKQQQLNQLHNRITQQLNKQFSFQGDNNIIDQIQKDYNNALRLKAIINDIRRQFDNVLFLGSEGIQQSNILSQLNLTYQDDNIPITTEELSYKQLMREKSKAVDIADFITFAFEKQLQKEFYSYQELDQNQKKYLQKLRFQVTSLIKSNQVFLLPQFIDQEIGEATILQSKYEQVRKVIQQAKDQNQIKQVAQTLLTKLNEKVQLKISKQIQQFLNSQSTQGCIKKELIMIRLLIAALAKKLSRIQIPDLSYQIMVDVSDILAYGSQHYSNIHQQISNNLDSNIIRLIDRNKLIFKVHQNIIIKVINKYFTYLIKKLLSPSQLNKQLQDNRFLVQKLIKILFKNILQNDRTILNYFDEIAYFFPLSSRKIKVQFHKPFLNNVQIKNNQFQFLDRIKQKIKNLQNKKYLVILRKYNLTNHDKNGDNLSSKQKKKLYTKFQIFKIIKKIGSQKQHFIKI